MQASKIFHTVLLTAAGILLGMIAVVNTAAAAREKDALIIANKDYLHGPTLDNPIKDAKVIAKTLTAAGFNVELKTDLGLADMRRAIRQFAAKEANTDNVALFYYSGHGAEVDGVNYLIPVDATLTDASKARFEALTLDDVQNFLHRDPTNADKKAGHFQRGLNIIVLDACRDNPYRKTKGGAFGGLGSFTGARGTLIWYATQPKDVTDDGAGQPMSPFAAAFTGAIAASHGEPVEDTFKQVALRTMQATDGRQQPWTTGYITGDFSFKPRTTPAGTGFLAAFDPARLTAGITPMTPPPFYGEKAKTIGAWNLGFFRQSAPKGEPL